MKLIKFIKIIFGLNESDKERNYCKYSKRYCSWKD